jgi:putative alpha-1,2-mannosidase
MGLFTYSPADPEYIVTVPLFDEVKFTQADGTVFTIRKEGEGEKITSIDLNGKKMDGWFLQDSDFKKEGTLTVTCSR